MGFELTRVGEPDVAVGMDEEVVNGVEVAAKIVVQQGGGFVCSWVKGSDSCSLLHAINAGNTSRCSPVDEPIVERATVGCIDRWVRQKL